MFVKLWFWYFLSLSEMSLSSRFWSPYTKLVPLFVYLVRNKRWPIFIVFAYKILNQLKFKKAQSAGSERSQNKYFSRLRQTHYAPRSGLYYAELRLGIIEHRTSRSIFASRAVLEWKDQFNATKHTKCMPQFLSTVWKSTKQKQIEENWCTYPMKSSTPSFPTDSWKG